MLRLSLKSASKWALFVYIIIFMVTTNTTINRIGQIVMLLFCGASWLFRSHLRIKKNNQLISMGLYGIMLVIASMYSQTPVARVQTVIIGYVFAGIVVLFLCDNIEKTEDIHFFLHAILIGSLVQFLVMLSYYGINIFEVIKESEINIRIGDDASNANSVGLSLAYGSVIAVYYWGTVKRKFLQIAYIVIAVLTAVLTFLSASRKALLVIVIGYFAILIFSTVQKNVLQKIRGVLIAIVGAWMVIYLVCSIPAFCVVFERTKQLIEGLLGIGALDHSSEARFSFIELGWKAFLEAPILGHGTYSSYLYFRTYSHNNFIEVLMNTGIIGFFLFYYPYVINIYKFLREKKKTPLFGLMLFLYIWIFLGGYGFVTYYDKLSMMLAAIPSIYLHINKIGKTKGDGNFEL